MFKDDYAPEVISSIEWNLYIDDLLKSCDNLEAAKSLIHGLTSLLKHGGFCLTKWISNSRIVLDLVLPEDRAKSVKDFEESLLTVERA